MWSEYLRMIDAQPVAVEELVLAFAQVQRHLGAALRPLDRLDRVFAAAVGLPAHAVLGRAGPRGA